MCKEMQVIPVDRVVDTKRIIGKMECREGGEAHGGCWPLKSYGNSTAMYKFLKALNPQGSSVLHRGGTDGQYATPPGLQIISSEDLFTEVTYAFM
jgi:hypothetical protein